MPIRIGNRGDNYTKVDGDDTFTVVSGTLKVTGLGANNETIVLYGENIGAIQGDVQVKFPGSSGKAGFVFGYLDSTHYSLLLFDPAGTNKIILQQKSGSGAPATKASTSYTPPVGWTNSETQKRFQTRKRFQEP